MHTEWSTPQEAQENGRLLRRTLQGNGIFSSLCTVLMIVAARPLSEWFGLHPAVFVIMGLAFIPFILFIFYIVRQPQINPTYARVILFLDVAWVVLTPLLLLSGWLPLTTEGKWVIVLTTDIVIVLAVLEYVGLRRLA